MGNSNFVETEKNQHVAALLPLDLSLKNSFTVVAIGASAGGLEAVSTLLKNLSPTTGMAFIYVQHLSPDHKSMLTPLLSKITKMKVQEIDDMETIEPNNVYVIPHDKEIVVTDGHIKLLPRNPKRVSNFSIDLLFSSLAETHKENVIGIVLSGNANDGTMGLKAIKQAGGITFAQDHSAKFASMPQSAIDQGVADFVLSPEKIADELLWISTNDFLLQKPLRIAPEENIDNKNPDLIAILEILQQTKNVDFSCYKMNTIKRRILRRMIFLKTNTLTEYAALLSKTLSEADILFQDLLINVTEFFRDSESFVLLKKSILPSLIKTKKHNETLRIWIAACATGEEAYSVAMILLELKQSTNSNILIQIFASDLSSQALALARTGEYSASQVANLSASRLQKYFIKTNNKYRISKQLRDMCIFAQHNILNDPPFSKMDFISCRNFLIYLDVLAQKKAIATFHYALNENGYLLLGKSETIGPATQLFSVVNKKCKFYSRKKDSKNQRIYDTPVRISHKNLDETPLKTNEILTIKPILNRSFGDAFDAVLLERFVPASVVINHDLEILQFRGQTSVFLENPTGKASFNILKMAHVEIIFELRNAIHQATKQRKTILKKGIEINREQESKPVKMISIEVVPLDKENNDPLLIVIFRDETQHISAIYNSNPKDNALAKDRRIKKLEEEISAARIDMNAISRDQETANEELQSANEEVISSNEELQSLNEELETSKEEIESTNEELITSNSELHTRILQVEELYNYYETIIATVHEPVLILDRNIRIKSANRSFCKMFQITEQDSIGVSLFRLADNSWNIAELREKLEKMIQTNNRFHDFEVEQIFPIIGQKTVLLNAHCIFPQSQNNELIVLTIADITQVKQLAIALEVKQNLALELELASEKIASKVFEDSNKRYNMLLLKSPFAFAIMKGKNMTITLANDTIKELWGKGPNVEGKTFLAVLPELKNGSLPALLSNVFKTGIPFEGSEFPVQLVRNKIPENLFFNFVYQPYFEVDETIAGVTVIAIDVTAQVLAKNELIISRNIADQKTQIAESAMQAKQQFLSNMSHEIRTPMNAIVGFTNIILQTNLTASQKQYIDAIKSSGDALLVLINDILDLAKVDAGKIIFEKLAFNLQKSVADVMQLLEIKIAEKNLEVFIDFDPSIPFYVVSDPLRIRQIILNLMSNAVKFTETGAINLAVLIKSETVADYVLEFTLKDTGIGIAAEKLDAIFNNFEQARSSTSAKFGGTGLGLAIVKKLIECQGGQIRVTSKVGFGSTFVFEMKFDKADPAKNDYKSIDDHVIFGKTLRDFKHIKILVAEDVLLNQLLIKIILESFQFTVEVVENGKVAIEKLSENSYDLILMDLHMPEKNGFEATAYIRHEMKSNIPIIALTADVTHADIDKCHLIGMNGFVSKPIDENQLLDSILRILKIDFD
ncbi:MAG: hypothetical protein RLZZ312_1044 [Bacteroidota bacterium]